jgi:hypothetical protein
LLAAANLNPIMAPMPKPHVALAPVLQVDLLLKQHQGMLKALYSRYRLKPSGGGLRPKVLKLDGWLALMAVRALAVWIVLHTTSTTGCSVCPCCVGFSRAFADASSQSLFSSTCYFVIFPKHYSVIFLCVLLVTGCSLD